MELWNFAVGPCQLTMSSLDGLTRAKMEAALPLDVETVERRTLAFLSKHGLRVRPMEDRELAAVLVADSAIYATSAPARIDTMREVGPPRCLFIRT